MAAQAQIALAQLNLGYTEVRAPFDGQMGKHLIDVGNVVGGNGQEAALADITSSIDLCGGEFSTAGIADPRQSGPATADAGRITSGADRRRIVE